MVQLLVDLVHLLRIRPEMNSDELRRCSGDIREARGRGASPPELAAGEAEVRRRPAEGQASAGGGGAPGQRPTAEVGDVAASDSSGTAGGHVRARG